MMKSRRRSIPVIESRPRQSGRAFLLAAGIAALLLPLLLLASAGRTYAAGFDVYDHEDLLTDAEEQDLARRYEDFCEKHGYRMFLLTAGSDEVGGYADQDSVNYIEAFGEQEIGESYLGLLINMDTRYFYIDVYGDEPIADFTDAKQEKLEEAVIEALYEEDIYQAGMNFASEAERQIRYDPRRARLFGSGIAAAVIGLIGSLSMVGVKSRRHKEKKLAADADIYADPASLHLSLNKDVLSHQYVTRVARIQNSGGRGFGSGFGGGHTTTHTSLGGGTHSGHGGHF